MKFLTLVLFALFTTLIITDIALARDLAEAAQSAQSQFNKIGVAAIGIGITIGGICFALGMAMLGRMILVSGAIGACAVLGGPAVVGLLGRIFGASL